MACENVMQKTLISGILDVGFQGQDVIATIQNVVGGKGAEELDKYQHPISFG